MANDRLVDIFALMAQLLTEKELMRDRLCMVACAVPPELSGAGNALLSRPVT